MKEKKRGKNLSTSCFRKSSLAVDGHMATQVIIRLFKRTIHKIDGFKINLAIEFLYTCGMRLCFRGKGDDLRLKCRQKWFLYYSSHGLIDLKLESIASLSFICFENIFGPYTWRTIFEERSTCSMIKINLEMVFMSLRDKEDSRWFTQRQLEKKACSD